jgi:hypothetical protein
LSAKKSINNVVMKKYPSSPYAAAVLVTIYAITLLVLAIVNYQNVMGFIEALALIVIVLVVLFALQRQTYLVIEDGELLYRQFSFKKSPIRIADVVEIRTGAAFGGLGVALYVIYRQANKKSYLKIYSKNFSGKTIDDFVKDIVALNPAIQTQIGS